MNSSVRHNESPSPQSSSSHLGDIYFVVFRHKWKIIILTVLGLVAALVYRDTKTVPYQSTAEILIKYVSDKIDPTQNSAQVTLLMNQNASIMTSELAMLTSFDVALEVATNVGPDKILAKLGGGNDPVLAASYVKNNLSVNPENTVINITYSNPDPKVVQPVLVALITAYLKKHDQVHQQIDYSDEMLTEMNAQFSARIGQIDQQLQAIKAKSGIINVVDSDNFFSTEAMKLRQELFQAQASLDEHNTRLAATAGTEKPAIGSTNHSADNITNTVVSAPSAPLDQIAQYKTVCEHLTYLQGKVSNYLNEQGYTEENKLVKEARGEIAATTKTKDGLEEKFPALVQSDVSVPSASSSAPVVAGVAPPPDTAASFADLPTHIKTLQLQLAQIQAQALEMMDAKSKIADLERQKQVQEDSLQKFSAALQDQHLKTLLGPDGNSNIPKIEAPTPPFQDKVKFQKIVFGLAVSGLVLGLAWAFLIEFYLDSSIKRPIDIQNKLKIPFFLSIPDLSHHKRGGQLAANIRRQLTYKKGSSENGVALATKTGSLEVMAGEINRRFDSYYDALRDRLVVYFESINLTRKPKLVSVTSTHKGAGVSTIAAGLAASLSETGDGRVLLVDMNQEHGTAQQFFQGHANCKLEDALESGKRNDAMVQENLYVVTEDTFSDRLPRALPKRFASLIPKLKASDYDYIIFDMPPVSPTSVTSRLAGLMDMVMLVVESEKTSQQVVLQANALLAQSNANVTVVLNKTRQYIPSRLHKDFLYDA